MSERIIVESVNDVNKDEVPEKSMQPFQSIWMSHWTHTRSRPPIHDAQMKQLLSLPKVNNSHSETEIVETGSSEFVKEFREMHKSITNECSTTRLRKSRYETSSKGQNFPMFKSSQNRDGIFLSLKNGESSSHHDQIGPASCCDLSLGPTDKCVLPMHDLAPSKGETHSLEESQFKHEDISSNSNKLLEEHRIVLSAPFKDGFLDSTSRTVPYSGSTLTESFFPRQDFIDQPSTSLVHDIKTNNNAALLVDDPSTSDDRLRDFLGEQSQTMPNHSDIELFHGQVRPQETMRICTTIGSLEEFSICPPKFSQTTHRFVFTKKTDVNLFDGGPMFRGSSSSTQLKGKQSSELLSLSPHFGFNIKQGAKLQSLNSSTDSEPKGNVVTIRTSAVDLRNESSAETDTMDMDTLRVNHLSGAVSSSSNKDINGAQKSQKSEAEIASVKEESKGSQKSEAAIASVREESTQKSDAAIASVREEIRCRLRNVELPDINQEVPAIPGVASSGDDGDASPSRTQSLDVEHFLSHAEHPTNSKSSACADDPLELDPYSRWVKRLKPSASYSFFHGTKSLKMGEASSHEKVKKLFSKMLNRSKTSSEPKMNKSHGKQQMVVDQTSNSPRNVESSHTAPVRKSQDNSTAWIQRWCRNQPAVSEKKPKRAVVCMTQCSTANQDKFQKKRYPSIAAMALMGKAMNGCHPCVFRKRESFVVWNTKGSK